MKRSYVAAGVVGVALAGLWYAAGGTRTAAARVSDPVAHANLAVYLITGPDAVDDARVVTLPEALERGWAVVHETGTVNQLAVENTSPDHDLFIQSGDIVKGGRQDRLMAADLLVPPGAGRVAVPSHCVEQSRWSGRGQEPAAYFAASDKVVAGNAIKLANANSDQSAVWAEVRAGQAKLSKNLGAVVNAPASPTSLQLTLESPAVRAKVGEYRAALAAAGSRPGVVGAVFVVNGAVTSADVYGSNGLFRRAWPRLLEAAATEALAEAAGDHPAPPPAREVERFLARAEQPDAAGRPDQPAGRASATRAANRTGNQHPDRGLEVNMVAGLPELSNDDPIGLPSQIGLPPQTEGRPDGPVLVEAAQNQAPLASFGRVNSTRSRLLRQGQTVSQPGQPPAPDRNPTPQPPAAVPKRPVNPDGNRLTTNRVESGAALMLEAKDPTRNAIFHKSYIKK